MTIDEAIKICEEDAEKIGSNPQSDRHAEHCRQIAEWLTELKEAKRLVVQLKAKLCDSSEYCAYCDELDTSEHDHFTCKYKKKKIPAVCYWQVLTPAYFDDIPWTKNEV